MKVRVVDAVSGKKKLRIQKYPDTCRSGLIETSVVLISIPLPKEIVLYMHELFLFIP